jgi:hypothetical protein
VANSVPNRFTRIWDPAIETYRLILTLDFLVDENQQQEHLIFGQRRRCQMYNSRLGLAEEMRAEGHTEAPRNRPPVLDRRLHNHEVSHSAIRN